MLKQALIISFDWSVLAHVKALEPLLSTGVVVSEDGWSSYGKHAAEVLVEQVKALGCDWVDFVMICVRRNCLVIFMSKA